MLFIISRRSVPQSETPAALPPLELAVIDAVAEDEIVDLLQRLIAVDTSEREEPAVRILCERLAAEGIEHRREPIAEGRDNVIATLGAPGGRTLLLSAHTDTVPVGNPDVWSMPPLGGVVRGGRVYGRGATDDKGGVAAMTMALVALARAGVRLRGRLLLTCVAGETQGNLGTRYLADRGLAADFAILGEYSEGDKIATTYRGALWGELTLLGKTAHPGRAHLGADTIRAALDAFLPALRDYRFTFRPHPLVPDPQLTITQIHAGHRRSAVADRCVITFDVRLVPGQRHREVWQELEAAIAAVPCPSGITPHLRLLYGLDAFETPADHPDVRLLAGSIEALTGRPARIMGKTGMCDGNVLVNRLGIPSVAYGPGNPLGAAVDEYCDVDRLVLCTRVYALTAMRMLGV